MTYNQFKTVEKYLDSIKVKTPEDVKFVKSSMQQIKNESIKRGEDFKDDLKNIRIHYQGQLALSNALGNYIGIAAILIALVIGMFSVSSSMDNVSLLYAISTLLFLIFVGYMLINTGRINKKMVSYTIIIQIIDELLENPSI
ncbi:hypothetical protein P4H67_25765 [Paenibacillus lautus]|uniref:hypothetical protein n=1 Tax=Paenibacillus lautus TaxID=1401 RepID=UPI002DBFBA6B|nr:hypothetical protein [Paenibacillus lautus]MEC0310166.1 hypothetical protein [Paenibacillus lautus]